MARTSLRQLQIGGGHRENEQGQPYVIGNAIQTLAPGKKLQLRKMDERSAWEQQGDQENLD